MIDKIESTLVIDKIKIMDSCLHGNDKIEDWIPVFTGMTEYKHLHNNDKVKIVDSRFHGNDRKIIDGDIRFPFSRE